MRCVRCDAMREMWVVLKRGGLWRLGEYEKDDGERTPDCGIQL